MFRPFFQGTLLLSIVGLTACSPDRPQTLPDMTGWVPQAALDSARATNRQLVNELAYATFRLEQCMGPDADLAKAEYYAERGERSKAKPYVDAAKAKGSTKTGEVEKRLSAPAPKKVDVAKDENLEVESDPVDQVTTIYDRRVPRSADTTTFYLYMGQDAGGAPWLRMRSQYSGDHWIHMHTIRISAGDLKYERRPDASLMFSKANALTVSEWNDTPPTPNDLRAIRKIIVSPDAQYTVIGHKGTISRKVTNEERDAFIHVLTVYEASAREEQAGNK